MYDRVSEGSEMVILQGHFSRLKRRLEPRANDGTAVKKKTILPAMGRQKKGNLTFVH